MILAQAFAFVRNLFTKPPIGDQVRQAAADLSGYPQMFRGTMVVNIWVIRPIFNELERVPFSSLHITSTGLRLYSAEGWLVSLTEQEARHLNRALRDWFDTAPIENFRFSSIANRGVQLNLELQPG
jgi:hypothetical protein